MLIKKKEKMAKKVNFFSKSLKKVNFAKNAKKG